MDVVKSAVVHLNAGQTQILTFDQPLFTLAKQIQWKWPDKYGEEKFVVMFGGLHIEMAALKNIGDWLESSGWAEALVQAEIATVGMAESLHKASHIMFVDGNQVVCIPPQQDAHLFAPCNHEEADSRMMLHVAHAAKHDHHHILVRTVDTDVVVLALMVAETLPADNEVWIAFGSGKHLRYLAAHQMAACLGSTKSLAIPVFSCTNWV